jgi:hypothetical protein
MNILTIAQADIEPKAKNAPKYKHLPWTTWVKVTLGEATTQGKNENRKEWRLLLRTENNLEMCWTL